MKKYFKPGIRSYDGEDIVDNLGMVRTNNYVNMNIYGGRSACLDNNNIGEYRMANAEIDYSTINYKEVDYV